MDYGPDYTGKLFKRRLGSKHIFYYFIISRDVSTAANHHDQKVSRDTIWSIIEGYGIALLAERDLVYSRNYSETFGTIFERFITNSLTVLRTASFGSIFFYRTETNI